MLKLFAALDVNKSVRFIGEVERGTACECYCPICSLPLVAKQGSSNKWYFAHRQGHGHHGCSKAVQYVMKCLVIQHLQSVKMPALPTYQEIVIGRSSTTTREVTVSWDAQPIKPFMWRSDAPESDYAADISLDNGIDVRLRINIASNAPMFLPVVDKTGGELVFWCPLPDAWEQLKRIYVMQHIRNCGLFVWRYQQDVFGLVHRQRQEFQRLAALDDLR